MMFFEGTLQFYCDKILFGQTKMKLSLYIKSEDEDIKNLLYKLKNKDDS